MKWRAHEAGDLWAYNSMVAYDHDLHVIIVDAIAMETEDCSRFKACWFAPSIGDVQKCITVTENKHNSQTASHQSSFQTDQSVAWIECS